MRIVVVGAGIVGAACAHVLASAGFDVTVLERGAVAGGTSSSCEGNLLVSDKTPGPELDLAVFASTRWPPLAAELKDQLGNRFPSIEYEPKGGVVVAYNATAADALLAFAETQRHAGVRARTITPEEALQLEPHLNPQIAAAVHYPDDAQVQPTVAVEALLASARKAGASVRTGERVVAALRDATGGRIVGVRTDRVDHAADVVVNAAGPWAGEVAALLGAPVPVLPRFGMVLVTPRMPHRVFHKVYDADYVGATQSGDADLQTSAVVESTAAGTVLIGSSRQRVGFDDRLDVRVIAQIAARAIALFPFLEHTQVMRTYGGFRPYMPDHLPVIGPDHRLAGLYHVTGHEGAGIGLSVVSADILLAQLTQSVAPLDPTPFALNRSTLVPHLREDAAHERARRPAHAATRSSPSRRRRRSRSNSRAARTAGCSASRSPEFCWRTTSSTGGPPASARPRGDCSAASESVSTAWSPWTASPTSAPASDWPMAVNTLSGNVSRHRYPVRSIDMAGVDVLIIGAGPAGLAAATSARRAGATVRVLEASDDSGGQFWRHLPASRPAGDEQRLHHQWQRYRQLRSAVDTDPALTLDVGAHVWAIERRDDGVRVNVVRGDVDGTGRHRESITARALVLATGAHDRALPVPGWTLPGVVTAGAAQAMAKGERIAIGERVVIAGAGPFLLPVTESLRLAGSTVVGVYEAAGFRRLARHWLASPWQLRSATSKMTELAGYVGAHLRGRIPYRPGWGVVAINGTDRVESATVARLDDRWRPRVGTERTVAVRRGVPGTRLHPAVGTGHRRGLRADRRPVRHRGRRPTHQRAVGVRGRRDHRHRRRRSRAGRRGDRRLAGRRRRTHRRRN